MADPKTAVATAVAEKKISPSAGENITKWLEGPQYAAYRDTLTGLIEGGEWAQLDELYFEVIPFGTGGRRGVMADLGSATINPRTVAESAHGLASYAKAAKPGEALSAVVTCDSRNNSLAFAKLTATTLAAHGLKTYFFPEARSTPQLSFAVRDLGCAVGVMVSASHNPPADNGFKAYWGHGGQVLAPHDKGIIEHVYAATEIPTVDFDEAVAAGQIVVLDCGEDAKYVKAVSSLSLSEARGLKAVFTPLHGVGETSCFAVLKQAGFDGVEIFEPQREQDGNFPNVADHFPNPERPQVFGPAVEHAKAIGADLVLASDPDADRVAIAVKGADGEFTLFTGNQTGALITDYVLRKRQGDLPDGAYVVETMVTTPLIGAIGKAAGVRVIDDLLVGFKYIGQTMEEEGPDGFVFGAEESLGYLAGQYARDKDAAIASLYICELAAELKAEGKTLLDKLAELHVAHGYHAEGQKSEKCPGPTGRQQIAGLMEAFRNDPPGHLAGLTLATARDYGKGEVRDLPANKQSAEIAEPSGELIFFDT
ncbi:MAG: phospho-sugar mutase, partial [Planctomycetota bacterium]